MSKNLASLLKASPLFNQRIIEPWLWIWRCHQVLGAPTIQRTTCWSIAITSTASWYANNTPVPSCEPTHTAIIASLASREEHSTGCSLTSYDFPLMEIYWKSLGDPSINFRLLIWPNVNWFCELASTISYRTPQVTFLLSLLKEGQPNWRCLSLRATIACNLLELLWMIRVGDWQDEASLSQSFGVPVGFPIVGRDVGMTWTCSDWLVSGKTWWTEKWVGETKAHWGVLSWW